MSVELEDRVTRLERRLKRLEFREKFLIPRPDLGWAAYARFVLEEDLNEQQLMGIGMVMESAQKSLDENAPVSAEDFREQLAAHIPHKLPPILPTPAYDFVKFTLMAFARREQYTDVYEHFQGDFNVPPLDRLRGQLNP